jgi:phage-related minor tail protein
MTNKEANDNNLVKMAQQIQTLKDQVKKLQAAHEEALNGKRQAIEMAAHLKARLAEYENEKILLARAQKINNITKLMQAKGMIDSTPDAYKKQLADLCEMDERALESWKHLVLKAPDRLNPVTAENRITNKKFGNMNKTFYIPDSDEKTAEKMNPLTSKNIFENLPWSGLPPQ